MTNIQVDFDSENDDDAVTLMEHEGMLMIWIETDNGDACFTREQFDTMVERAYAVMQWK